MKRYVSTFALKLLSTLHAAAPPLYIVVLGITGNPNLDDLSGLQGLSGSEDLIGLFEQFSDLWTKIEY